LELKSGIVVSEFLTKNGNKVILRYPKWEDLDNLVVYWNDMFEETEKDPNFGILFEKKSTPGEGAKWLAELLVRVETGEEICLVAVTDGAIVGFVNVTRGRPSYERHQGVLGISIAREFREMGIGSELIRSALDECRKAGLVSVELAAFHSNLRAIRLYERLGFKHVGRIPKKTRRDGRFFDDVIMWIEL
jgi:ribosomal protein S18 acetylase RimI-like enzyme